jgi:signal transduction histidine kinase
MGLDAALDWYVEEFHKRRGIKCELFLGKQQLDIKGEPATAIFHGPAAFSFRQAVKPPFLNVSA